jgi:hypothetical protein
MPFQPVPARLERHSSLSVSPAPTRSACSCPRRQRRSWTGKDQSGLSSKTTTWRDVEVEPAEQAGVAGRRMAVD